MKLYLDVSCLNRPFDEQDQLRVRLETMAINFILARCDSGEWRHVSSEAAEIEIGAIKDPVRRDTLRLELPTGSDLLELSNELLSRGTELEQLGFTTYDALHIAAAEYWQANVLLTCDDRMLKRARRLGTKIFVTVANPLDWLKEHGYGDDA